ncbi:MAG TPA: serine protease [Anaeromyxobacteraceae bacterium]|nr:serine protease [Anaeromyxobacteraceae bacterium]
MRLTRASMRVFLSSAMLALGPQAPARADPPPSPPAPPAASPGAEAPPPGSAPSGAPYCAGEYADDLAALSARAREFEQAQKPYTFCIRTTATYECPSYAPDGTLRRSRTKVVAHGTGFAFRQQAAETLLLTNEHVAEWPAVTSEEHAVEEVPPGCKLVSNTLAIVDDEKDEYPRDDVPLSRVVSDPELDVAVLRAKATLPVVPWKLGRSAALRERNVVDVRGFPLGVLRANNVGKVVSAYDHDEDGTWDHDDFVVDALLSPGNSGSPVFAVSCRTGEFELVGVYHAAYARGSALNVVIGIDQLRDLLATLKRAPRPRAEGAAPLDAGDRARVSEAAGTDGALFFGFGPLLAAVRGRPDGALLFALMSKDFPIPGTPALVLEDLPAPDAFGALARVWAGNRQGLSPVDRGALDAESQGLVARLLETLRRDALSAAALREASRQGLGTRERYQDVARRERAARRVAGTRQDLAQAAADLDERLCPATADARVTWAQVMEPPAPALAGADAPVVLAPAAAVAR